MYTETISIIINAHFDVSPHVRAVMCDNLEGNTIIMMINKVGDDSPAVLIASDVTRRSRPPRRRTRKRTYASQTETSSTDKIGRRRRASYAICGFRDAVHAAEIMYRRPLIRDLEQKLKATLPEFKVSKEMCDYLISARDDHETEISIRAYKPPESRWSPPPVDTHNPGGVTDALSIYWDRNRVSDEKRSGPRQRGVRYNWIQKGTGTGTKTGQESGSISILRSRS
ncbi:hypothetical protein EVAR_55814_1 [Eumeta japonica]|uniref:Uncharacterized protein n=1 Tax=Eumeta variegata TaxID=151549 RepID=A0A4C1ZF82_EUMVA|nr:hypothetical protein EVAR_55814_1 [Eumeta japonica]